MRVIIKLLVVELENGFNWLSMVCSGGILLVSTGLVRRAVAACCWFQLAYYGVQWRHIVGFNWLSKECSGGMLLVSTGLVWRAVAACCWLQLA
jgi:hypothetical protein